MVMRINNLGGYMAKTKELSKKRIYQVGFAAALVGLLASFNQAIQTINHYKFPDTPLTCDINSVFNCNGVFNAWQSSVFGFSNSLMCIVFFTFLLGLTVAGLTGSSLSKNVRLFAHFLVVFFLGFGAWYLWSSTFVIAALCIYCIFCYAAVITLNFVWLRINIADLPVSDKIRTKIEAAIKNNYDIAFWIVWAGAIAGMFAYKFL
jgi:uncharacterized membrane protein